MRIWISLLALVVFLGMSRTAQAQYSNPPVGTSTATSFAGVGSIGNTQFLSPNVASSANNPRQMNLFSSGLVKQISTMNFFKSQYAGYNTYNTQYPEMGLSYLQSFGYRVAQPAK
jgi:hypothetical protein